MSSKPGLVMNGGRYYVRDVNGVLYVQNSEAHALAYAEGLFGGSSSCVPTKVVTTKKKRAIDADDVTIIKPVLKGDTKTVVTAVSRKKPAATKVRAPAPAPAPVFVGHVVITNPNKYLPYPTTFKIAHAVYPLVA